MSEKDSQPLYTLTVGEYIELNRKTFSEEAKKLLLDHPEEKSKEAYSDIIFMAEVMKLTGYRRATLYSKVSRFEIPVLTRKKPLSFSRKAILKWLEDGKPNVIDQEAEAYLGTKRK